MSNLIDLYLADFTVAGSGGRIVAVHGGFIFYQPFGSTEQVHSAAINPAQQIIYKEKQAAHDALKDHVEDRVANAKPNPLP